MSGGTQEPRTAVMILVEASWLDQSGTLRSVQARMENRSAHGACIRIKAKVGVGARVYIRSHREQFSGIAKYCRVDGKEFLVGIQKDAVNYPIPKGPMPGKGPAKETARAVERVEEAGPVEASGAQSTRFKAGVTWKNKSVAGAKRDAEWLARRTPEPWRDSVSDRGNGLRAGREEGAREEGTMYRAPTVAARELVVARDFVARIEEPIAARLMEHDARRAESPPRGAAGKCASGGCGKCGTTGFSGKRF